MTVLKWGEETLVNTSISGEQGFPAVATLAGGGYVISWTASDPADGDGDALSIKFQRYDDAGNKLGGEVIADFDGAGDQLIPSVAGTSGGGFTIGWLDL